MDFLQAVLGYNERVDDSKSTDEQVPYLWEFTSLVIPETVLHSPFFRS